MFQGFFRFEFFMHPHLLFGPSMVHLAKCWPLKNLTCFVGDSRSLYGFTVFERKML